ncbi:SpaA isopeptide-forming pilin-related protein [Lacticaseibacillus jixiensis]|uniref:SpaA isopeptide-forming pilin-related protein n=1 Tax=Lacticaseibacillus jixiensis TaxID=3231926 RepID=UPI0036F305B1
MLKKKWRVFGGLIAALGCAMVAGVLLTTGTKQATAADALAANPKLKPQEQSYYQSYSGTDDDARFDLLGAAQRFHVFSRSYYSSTAVSGNIATQNIYATNNIRSDGSVSDLPTKELPYYFGKIQQFPGTWDYKTMTIGEYPAHMVIGPQVKTGNAGNSGISVFAENGQETGFDSLPQLYQEQAKTPYLDFDYEFNHLKALSDLFATYGTSTGVKDKGQDVKGDGNARTYDVAGAEATYPIRVTKWGFDANGSKRLAGVKFGLYQSDGKGGYGSAPIKTGVTRNDGMLRFRVTVPGEYGVKELDVGDNSQYALDATIHPVHTGSRDATYIDMPLKEALGSLATDSASKITIKGLATSDTDTTGNPGPVIINVNCDDDPKYPIEANHPAPNIILADTQGNEITGGKAESSRVLWNFYRTTDDNGVPTKIAQDPNTMTDLPADFTDQPVLDLGNDTIEGTILAPYFNVRMGGSAHLDGMIAANKVYMASGADSTRQPLDFKLFDGGNDVLVNDLSFSNVTKSLTVEKTWQALDLYPAQSQKDYPAVSVILNGKTDETSASLTNSLSWKLPDDKTLPQVETWRYRYRLPGYAPILPDDSPPPDPALKQPDRLLHAWMQNYDTQKVDEDKTGFANAKWLSTLNADKNKPISYTVTEGKINADPDSKIIGLDAYLNTGQTTSPDQQTVTMHNTQFGIQAQKFGTDNHETPLAAEFEVDDADGNKVMTLSAKQGTATTDSLKPLAPGTYTIKETKSPDGYQQDPKPYTFTLGKTITSDKPVYWHNKDGSAITATAAGTTTGFYIGKGTSNCEVNNLLTFVQYDPPLWTINVHKQDDASHKALSDVTFDLTNAAQATAKQTLTTDDTGDATTGRKISSGTYTLSETSTPEGYAPLGGTAKINIASDGKTATVALGNGFTGTQTVDQKNYTINITVNERKKGTLPSTGGTGFLHPLELAVSLFIAAALMFILAWWQKRKGGDAA